ncbi:MAG TPA: hypothetical protein VF403_19580 [Kofleriaceae bacterium]
MTEPNQDPAVVNLVDAGVPADQGLSALGMLMQLAGNVLAAYVALITFSLLFEMRGGGSSETLWAFLILGLSIGRSLLQRSAGSTLLYGDPNIQGGRMRGVQRYIKFALAQSLLFALIFKFKFEVPAKATFAIFIGLVLWPALLAGLLTLPRFKRFNDDLPLTEDKGFEGASILMTMLGLCGVIATGTALIILFQMPARELQHGASVVLILSLCLLVVRSIMHVQAGVSGLRETSVDRSVELANRYANFGVIAAFCTGGATTLWVMSSAMNVAGLAIVCGMCWMLLAWPMIIRRFFSDRQFADLLAGDNAPVHRRAPDAGATWLGWFLIAHCALMMSFILPQIIMGVDGGGGGFGGRGGAMGLEGMMSVFGQTGMRSVWWSIGLYGLQGWAGFELVRMSAQSKTIASVFGIAGIAITLYINWPLLQMLKHAGGQLGEGAMMFGPLALAMVIPVATLVLVNRKIAPTAQARFRSKA